VGDPQSFFHPVRDAVGGLCQETFPLGRRCVLFPQLVKDGTWVRIHDSLRQWVRVDLQPSPSEAIIDSQSIKSAMLSQDVGLMGKIDLWTQTIF